jgi:hypothetical protein
MPQWEQSPYKHQFVNAVQGNNPILHWQWVSYRIHKYKMQSFWLFKRLVHIVTIWIWRVNPMACYFRFVHKKYITNINKEYMEISENSRYILHIVLSSAWRSSHLIQHYFTPVKAVNIIHWRSSQARQIMPVG